MPDFVNRIPESTAQDSEFPVPSPDYLTSWGEQYNVLSNLPSNFPDLEKIWKMEITPGKMVKSLVVVVFKATATTL